MIRHQGHNHITCALGCPSCNQSTKIWMETGLLQCEWTGPSCGQENHYENNEALTVMGMMRPEDLRK